MPVECPTPPVPWPGRHQTVVQARENITSLMGWTTYLAPDVERIAPMTTTTDYSLIHTKWSNVMCDVASLAKSDRNPQQGFNFRGIDAVMNALGPALRGHGVYIYPRVVTHKTENYTTAKGAQMRGVAVEVEYTVVAEDGSYFTGSAWGEASDSGDKATPKAMSVAYRTFLLQALTLPTDEPDPDSMTHERVASAAAPPPAPSGPPIEPDTIDAIQDLFDALGLDEAQQRGGIAHNAGRNVPVGMLTEREGQVVLLALQRKMQALQAAPTPEAAEDNIRRALGGQPVEEPQDDQA